MSIARIAFRYSRGILLAVLLLSLLGGLSAKQMPSAILPDFPFPRLVIITLAGDMAIQDMIPRVTRPLEAAASGVPSAKNVRSKTARGSVEISVDFEWGTNMFEAFTRLNANVATLRSSLPPEASVQVEWVNPSSFPIIGYSLTSEKQSARDLYDVANLNLAPYLSRLKGVYRVTVQGSVVREYQVIVNPGAAAAAGISPDQVSDAISAANLIQAVGRINRHVQGYLVLVDAQVRHKEELLDVSIPTRMGKSVRVRDIATVVEGSEETQQVVTADGREAVLLNILKQPGASTSDVSAEVTQALAELKPHLLEGIRIKSFYDEAELLHESLGSLRDSIVIGAILSFLVLIAFLRSWRSTLVVLICLPITMLIAFLGLKMWGQTLNIMTLGGLAVGLGLVIDDVVVTLENIFRHAEMRKSPRQAAIDGATEIQKPMIGSTMTTVAVFLPLAFLSEITGALFAPLAITLTLLLLISVVLAVTVVPLISSKLLRRSETSSEPEAVHQEAKSTRVTRTYEKVVSFGLANPIPICAVAIGLALISAALVPSLPSGLMPEMDEGAFVLDYAAPPGMPLADTDRQLRQVEHVLMSTPEVESYSRRTGIELGFFTTEPSRGDMMVKLKPRGIRHKTSTEVADEVLARCKELLPGMELETVAPIADRVNDIAGEPSPIEVKVFGDDAETLDKLAVEVQGVVKSIRGSADSVHDVVATGPELAIHIDSERASRLGVTTRDIARTIQASMLGRTDSSAVDGERVIGIRVAFPKNARRTMEEVRELPVLSKSGKLVPLSAIATFSENPGAHEVMRENQKPVMLVTAALSGRDLGSANREAKERVAKEVKLPPGYTVQFGGLYATQQASFASLTTVLVTSMLLVFVVLLFQYNRFAEPAALLLAAAFSLVGVIGVMKVTGTHLNASSMTGAIMIFGMVLTNGIVLMDTIGLHRAAGLPLGEAILQAGVQRIRPVFMTASIAVLALLPLAFSVGAGADMQKPLAIAVIGGLLVSPLFTLVLAPVLMYVFRRGK